MAKIYTIDKTQVSSEKMAKIYDYMAENYNSCRGLIEDIREKRMTNEDRKNVFSGEKLSFTDRIKYNPFLRKNERILKDIKKLGYEEFLLGLTSFIDLENESHSEEEISASLRNLADFQRRLRELGFEYVYIADKSNSVGMELRFNENFITDGEIKDYNVTTPGIFSYIVGDDEQRLDIKLEDASFLLVEEQVNFRNKETFVNNAYILNNHPNKNSLRNKTEETLFTKEHPLMKELNQSMEEENYVDCYKELYDERLSFFQDLKKMKKHAKDLGIFESIIQGVEGTDMEKLMDQDDLNLLKALMLKKRTLDGIPKQKINKK